jgi:hypothetical protein
MMAQAAADTVIGRYAGTTGDLSAGALTSCSATTEAVTYNTTTHAWGCHDPIPASTANPFTIGPAQIGAGDGVTGLNCTSITTLPEGSVCMQTDVSGLWRMWLPPTLTPTRVQEKSIAGNTYALTLTSTPTPGDYLIAACYRSGSLPAANTGWFSKATHNQVSFDPYVRVVTKLVKPSDTIAQTPCTGTDTYYGATVIEVSGLDMVNFNNSLAATAFNQATGTGTLTVTNSATTTSANQLGINIGALVSAAASIATPLTENAGWTNTSVSTSSPGPSSVAIGSQVFASSSSSVTATVQGGGSVFSNQGLTGVLILLQQPTGPNVGMQRMSDLAVVKSAGVQISPTDGSARSIDFSTGLTATDDGNGAVTVTSNFVAASPGPIGNTTASTGAFTTLSASSTVSGAGFSTYLASPPAIGGTVAAAITGSSLTDTGVTGTALNCAYFDSAGLLHGTGTACGSAVGGTVTSVTCAAITTVTITSSGTCPYSPNPNRLVNGAMEIDQANEAATVSVTTGNSPYSADQWQAPYTGAATGVTIQQVADAPQGFLDSIKVTIGTGSATLNAGDSLLIIQNIEGINVADLNFGGANAQAVSLSFWIKSNITGTFGYGLRNSARNRSYVSTCTISSANTWTQCTLANIGGDTSGTWLTAEGVIGLTFHVALMSGSTGQGTAGSWQAANVLTTSAQTNLNATSANNFQLTGVKVEQSAVVTPYLRKPFSEEFLNAQRYYEKTYDPGTAVGATTFTNEVVYVLAAAVTNGSTFASVWPFKATKAKTPTVTVYRPRATVSAGTVDVAGASVAVTSGNVGRNNFLGPVNNSGVNKGAAGNFVEYEAVADARL